MTGLLVSVRSAVEAQLAFGGGADVVDVKEPSRGSLGAADPSTWKEILDQLGGCVVTSAALGELTDDAVAGLAVQTAGFRFAKVGLSNWNTDSHRRWRAVCDAIPSAVKLVPVVYADATAAGWPSVLEMMGFAFSLARDANSRLILIDTFLKQGQTLLDLVSVAQLHCIIRDAASQRIGVALAGSLGEPSIARLLPLEPAYIGVRGAACLGGRDGTIDLARVKSLALLVRRARRKAAS